MPRLSAEKEFETDDEWSFISPGARTNEVFGSAILQDTYNPESPLKTIDGRHTAKASDWLSTKRSVSKSGTYTYTHREASAARDGTGNRSEGQAKVKAVQPSIQAWWSPGPHMRCHSADVTAGMGMSKLAAAKLDAWESSERMSDARSEHVFIDADSPRGASDRGGFSDAEREAWLSTDPSRGFIRVYSPDIPGADGNVPLLSRLIPCTTSAEAHEICHVVRLPPNSLHIQLNGDVVRRLDPYERPLAMQNEYLARIGYSHAKRIQWEGLSADLGYLVRFYSGKSFDDSTYARRQLSAILDVRPAGILQRWTKRLCTISGTRLTVHKDKTKQSEATTLQLAKGSVGEVKMKGRDLCIRLSTSCTPQKTVLLSFSSQSDYNKWFKKARKATAKLPSSADLSGCNLEFLPETVFANDQLTLLNLRHNALRSMPTEENIYTIGWLDDLSKFIYLKSLNLADNALDFFPPAICDIKSLVELNLATNRISAVPAAISQLTNLQALHLHNNHLSTLPPEVTLLKKLVVLVLAFNKFRQVPACVAMLTDVRVSECETLIMAGNLIESLPGEVVAKLRHVKKVDLRMNGLTLPLAETVRFNQLEHLTHLDVRDNYIKDLDIRYVKTLEYLNCERNNMSSLQIHGAQLRNLVASRNEIQQMMIVPKPEWLETIDFSRNKLDKLPEWLAECYFLSRINVSHNKLSSLPPRIFADAQRLKFLQADHNRLKNLPSEIGTTVVEEVYLHSNHLHELPRDFLNKTNKLRLLNLSANKLASLPLPNDAPDLNKLQELLLTQNQLRDDCLDVVICYTRLKVLHLAHNNLTTLPDKFIESLELLQELNVSANQIDNLPTSMAKLVHLKVLRAHSNRLHCLPQFIASETLKVLDVSCNPSLTISAADFITISRLAVLDTTIDESSSVNDDEDDEDKPITGSAKNSRRSVPMRNMNVSDIHGRQHSLTLGSGELVLADVCEVGVAETSGSRNKLCVAALSEQQFYDRDEAIFGVFDGGRNDEVARALKNGIPHILNEEVEAASISGAPPVGSSRSLDYMKYTLLTAHKRLRGSGQRLGASAVLCHLRKRNADTPSGGSGYVVNVANCGDACAVLCRSGEAMLLSRSHLVPEDRDECRRIFQSDGIITEEGKVNGNSHVSRCIGNNYLYPQVLPVAHVASEPLRPAQDQFIIIANGALWRYLTHAEAVRQVQRVSGATSAAKSLQDLAQAYGCIENLCIVVVRFGRSRPSAATSSLDSRSRQPPVAQVLASLTTDMPSVSKSEGATDNEENYVNIDHLRPSTHVGPSCEKRTRRPVPTPRVSLSKVNGSSERNDEPDFDDREDYRALPESPGKEEALRRLHSAAVSRWSSSMVREWQFRSDGFLIKGEASSSSSSTLTVSTEYSDDDFGSDDADAEMQHRSRRQARKSCLPVDKARKYSSDTRLQHPSDIEFGNSAGYFNRPSLLSSSLESFPDDSMSVLAKNGSTESLTKADSSRQIDSNVATGKRQAWIIPTAKAIARENEYISVPDQDVGHMYENGSAYAQAALTEADCDELVSARRRRADRPATIGKLSEADIRALQTYSDSSILTYKGDAIADAVSSTPLVMTTPLYRGTDNRLRGERNADAADDTASRADVSHTSRPFGIVTPSHVLLAPSREHSAQPPVGDERLHPGVHTIDFYQEQPAKLQRKDKASNDSSSAYGSLLSWASSTVSHYDTYL